MSVTIHSRQKEKDSGIDWELNSCVELIIKHNFKHITLQFPDALLVESTNVFFQLRKMLSDKLEVVPNLYVLGDTSYNSCCVDEIAAEHVNSDFLIHFGPACLEK